MTEQAIPERAESQTCSWCAEQVPRSRDGAYDHHARKGHYPTFPVTEAAHVTEEILNLADDYADMSADDRGRIDWEDLVDRLDGLQPDATLWAIDMGNESDSPAIRAIQREIRKRRREG